ncbi:hypothetical protein FKM82_026477 [Ascaphus truei]
MAHRGQAPSPVSWLIQPMFSRAYDTEVSNAFWSLVPEGQTGYQERDMELGSSLWLKLVSIAQNLPGNRVRDSEGTGNTCVTHIKIT